MSYSISASKAKATHDTAMSIIEKDARERASKTQYLRELRLAQEAQMKSVEMPAGAGTKVASLRTALKARALKKLS